VIALGLGVLVILMVILPTVLFGGQTWYKRLGWITVLLCIFALLFLFPTVSVVVGIIGRLIHGRYKLPYLTDILHLVLAAFTIAVHVWTVLLAIRAATLVHRLSRGDYGPTQVSVRK
jgi:hypothetical protein